MVARFQQMAPTAEEQPCECPPPTAHLEPTINFLRESYLATGNQYAYSTGFQTFKSFLLMVGLWIPGSNLLPHCE